MKSTGKDEAGTQRTEEWDRIDQRALDYHLTQWETPKRSTLAFRDFAGDRIGASRRIVDLGCGAGAATASLAEHFPRQEFVGVDISTELIEIAARLGRQKSLGNLSFRSDNWYSLGQYPEVDGVVSMQSLSWLPEFETPLLAIFERLAPRWIALSSLFYDGQISSRVEVEEHLRARKTFYNVYSLPVVDEYCRRHGYRVAGHQPFELDIDIPPPADRDLMSTYTVATQAGRLQISGPLLLNWRFVLIERMK